MRASPLDTETSHSTLPPQPPPYRHNSSRKKKNRAFWPFVLARALVPRGAMRARPPAPAELIGPPQQRTSASAQRRTARIDTTTKKRRPAETTPTKKTREHPQEKPNWKKMWSLADVFDLANCMGVGAAIQFQKMVVQHRRAQLEWPMRSGTVSSSTPCSTNTRRQQKDETADEM